MKVITSSDLRANMANVFDAIEADAEDVVVARSGREPLVVMLKSAYDAWRETEYLSRGANGRELRRRMAEMEKGSCVNANSSTAMPRQLDEAVGHRSGFDGTWTGEPGSDGLGLTARLAILECQSSRI